MDAKGAWKSRSRLCPDRGSRSAWVACGTLLDVVHGSNRGIRFGFIGESDEAKTTAASGVAIFDDYLYGV
jgi:hypothetical protein